MAILNLDSDQAVAHFPLIRTAGNIGLATPRRAEKETPMTIRDPARLKRRDVLRAAAGSGFATLAARGGGGTASAEAKGRTFVLIHGA